MFKSNGIEVLAPDVAKARPEMVDAYHAFVKNSPQGSIYCHTWWLEAVAPGLWRVLLIMRDGQIDAAWPLTTIVNAEGELFTAMPPLTQKLGILLPPHAGDGFAQAEMNFGRIERLIDQLPSDQFFNQRFHEEFTNWMPFMWRDYSHAPRITYILENIESPEDLWNAMRGSTRRQLNKAQKAGVEIIDDMPIDRFLPLHRMTYIRQEMEVPVDDEVVQRLDAAVSANAERRIFAGIDAQGRDHAAAWVCWHNGVAYYIMGGSNPDLRKSDAHRLSLWESIKTASEYASAYDFEGSMLQPIEDVYRGFGGRQVQYSQIGNRVPWEHLFEFEQRSMMYRVRRRLGFELGAWARRIAG